MLMCFGAHPFQSFERYVRQEGGVLPDKRVRVGIRHGEAIATLTKPNFPHKW